MKKNYLNFVRKTGACAAGILFLLFMGGLTTNAQLPDIWSDGIADNWETVAPSMPLYKYIPDNYMLGLPDNQFQQGSKDYKYAADNSWAEGQTKNKNDLANSAVALVSADGKKFLCFAGDRARVQGAAQIGFWLLLNGTMPTPPNAKFGSFDPEHAKGDLLIVADFSNGGRMAAITLYKWVGGSSGEGNLLKINPTGIAVAQNNEGPTDVPSNWQYESGSYKKNAFYEGYIDLAKVLDTPVDFCKASWLLECRSSKELNASLDDFAAGKFADEIPCDITGPNVVCPKDEITFCGPEGPYTYKWKITDGYFVGPDDQQCMKIIAANHCGEFTVTLTVTDYLGCEKSCSTTYKVVDNESPKYKDCTPAVVELGCNPDPAKYACTLKLENWSDNCRINSAGVNAGIPKPDETGCGWSVKHVTWAIDYCGNKSICEQNFHWKVDITPPVLPELPKGGDLGCNPKLPVCVQGLMAKDNCDGLVPVTCKAGEIKDLPNCKKQQTFTYSAIDECLNPVWKNVVYTWKEDLVPPVLPPLPTGGDLGCNPTLPVCKEGLLAKDFCDGPVPVKCVPGPILDLPKCGKTQTFTYSAIDECLNPVSKDVVYTWKEDLVPPVPDPYPVDLVFACGQTPVIPDIKFTDACDGPVPSTCEVVGHPGADCATFAYPVGETEICYSSKDACHNSITICIKVTVQPCPCETAYATLENDNAQCFIPDFAKWGWSNKITEPGTYTLPLYAGAAQCKGGDLAGIVVVMFTAEGKVTVVYNIYPGYQLDSKHLYVGYTQYPLMGGTPTVAPGQYTFDADAVYTAPFYVIAHAVVCGSPMKNASAPGVTGGFSDLKVYPNPFDRVVTFEFISDRDARAILDIYNLTGQKITTLVDRTVRQGVVNRVDYQPLDQANGIFFYRMNLDGVISTGKLMYNRK